ncbi:MAG: hypothetical protein M0P12_07345 [Paludibacteraceae bacterium]|nr:hypothetical protein [Paludibacteraceae bacterium]
MRGLLLLISLFLGLSVFAEDNNLTSSDWKIKKITCDVVSSDPSKQSSLDSCLSYLRKDTVSEKDEFIYSFTDSTMERTNNNNEDVWSYKLLGDKMIVELGMGRVYIFNYKVDSDTTLVLEMSKQIFMLSEFAPKDKSMKDLIKSVSLKYYFNKIEP